MGLQNIAISFDQTSSNTGPKSFQLQYSTDGSNFTNLGSAYTVLANASPNTPWSTTGSENMAYNFSPDLSSVASTIAGQSTLYFRLEDSSTTSANGGTVATAGTDRVDNVIISGTAQAVPEPLTVIPACAGLFLAIGACIRRKVSK